MSIASAGDFRNSTRGSRLGAWEDSEEVSGKRNVAMPYQLSGREEGKVGDELGRLPYCFVIT